MSDLQFNVVLIGVLPDFDPEKAQQDFATLFSLDAEKAANLFASKKSVLKANVTRDLANKFVDRLAVIGVNAIAEPIIIDEDFPDDSDFSESEESVSEEHQNHSPEFHNDKFSAAITQEFPKVSFEKDAKEKHQHAFTFTGKGTEYFKIWIVNILLSIVTLGIYSAWAKVRNKQYFYGNTHIADHTFEYTAEPLKILKGRVIAFVIYLAVVFSHHISPLASVIATIVVVLFLPFIIVNSLKFNARHSSYRNIPFRFTGTVWGALKVFILLPVAGILTIGLLMPLAWKRQVQYITNNHLYGSDAFKFDVDIKEYFFMLMILVGVSMACFVVIGGIVAAGSVFLAFTGSAFDAKSWLLMVPIILGYTALYLAIGAYFMVSMANIHWNNTKLKNHQFTANWTTPSFFSLLATNTFGILFTLGLFIPFAKVRTAIYKANHTAFIAEGNLDDFIANELEQSNSLAEGVHDIFDIDISI